MGAPTTLRRLALLSPIAVFILAGCYLIEDNGPATLQPRPRFTEAPLPTLGYSTLVPEANGIPAPTPIAQVSGAQLYTLLSQITSTNLLDTIQTLQNFQTRHINSRQDSPTVGVGAAQAWLYNEFLEIQQESRGNFQAFRHEFTAQSGGLKTTQYNIAGYIQGSVIANPAVPAIVIGAHYDSRTDDLSDASGFAPGADDNGSGVAAVLEIARVMSQLRPRTTMIFVLFAAEEVNRQGSKAFVRDYIQFHNIPVRVMINVDTVGSVNDPRGNVNDRELRIFSQGPDESPSRDMARMIDFMIENYSTDLKLVFVEEIDREGRFGDHFSFNEVGIPAVRIIEALEDTPNREGRDTIEYVEPEYLRKSTRTLATMMLALSDGMPHPSQVVVRDVGEGRLRVIWEPVDGATGYIVALRSPGEVTFEAQFPTLANETAFDCPCFLNYSGIAIGALNENGIIGPLSPEVKPPHGS
jgi:hypothetical protein